MNISTYWPQEDEVDRCIRTEAETADEAVLLAVHEPARLSRRQVHTKVEEEVDERQLLDAFTEKNLASGSLLMPITGASGVGKSHMIRWLGAQLRRHPRAELMHIITIPKSASLRGVIERILEPLVGAEYDELRKAVNTSVASVSDADAALRLSTELQIVLNHQAKEMKRQLQTMDAGDPSRTAMMAQLHHAENIGSLISDASMAGHFQQSILPRIVRRTLHGLEGEATDEAIAAGQFSEADFSGLEQKGIADATKAAHLYYRRTLSSLDGRHLRVAVQMLNQALDPAVRGVFQLSRSAGQMTIEEIVERVRQQLGAEGRELVILVEDFAALAGIQESILNISIVEATHAGRMQRSVIRTALAVTDGYLVGRDTILTRAKYQWIVKSRFDSEELLIRHCVNVTGRYLNAARWGAAELVEQYRASQIRGEDVVNWTKPFEIDHLDAADSDTLSAFGKDDNDHWLFPFNREAIAELSKRAMPRLDNVLQFNPRAVIDGVLREPLLLRRSFVARQFPESGYKSARLDAQVQIALADSVPVGADVGRLGTVLAIWGGGPQTVADAAAVAPAIFRAFSLDPPMLKAGRGKPRKPIGPPGPTPPSDPVVVQPRESEETEAFRGRLRSWANGGQLSQPDGLKIRNEWAAAICARVDEMELRVRGVFRYPAKVAVDIYIAGARTTNPDLDDPHRMPIILCPDGERDPTGRLQVALLAMRKRIERDGWSYQGSEEDFAAYAWLLDGLAEQAINRAHKDVDARLAFLVPRLRLQSALLGVPTGGDRITTAALFADAPLAPGEDGSIDPGNPTTALYAATLIQAHQARRALQGEVAQLAACFQGESGKKPLAFDAIRILGAAEKPIATDARYSRDWQELREHLTQLTSERLTTAAQRVVDWLKLQRSAVSASLGEKSLPDLTRALERIRELAVASNVGTSMGIEVRHLQELDVVSSFDLLRLGQRADAAAKALQERSLEAALRSLATMQLGAVGKVVDVLKQIDTALSSTEATLRQHEKVLEETDPEPIAAELEVLLADASSVAAELSV